MKEVTQSRDHRIDIVDDECSNDSGCSSSGSTGSAELLYSNRIRGRSSICQERLRQLRPKSSRSWSPEEKAKYRDSLASMSSSQSTSASDTPIIDCDSFKRTSPVRDLRKALQNLRISGRLETRSTSTAEIKSNRKKNQHRILRSPIAYTYVKGLSGLPTQRIPRNAI